MELANLCFGHHASTLHGQVELAQNLGFQSLGLLSGGHLPDYDQASTPVGVDEHSSPQVSALSLDLLASASDGSRPCWKEVPIATILNTLIGYQCRQLVVPAGQDERLELRARAAKLLSRVHQGEVVSPQDEALEELLVQSGLEMERQLERLAAFLHDLRRAAPGLKIALQADAAASGLLNPQRLRLLSDEIQDLDIGFWHDTGLAELRLAGGLEDPGEWLDGFSNIMQGSTLHDFSGGVTHLPPGIGKVDWQLLAEYIPRSALRVMAVAPSYPNEVLVEARTTLESRLPS